MPVKILTATVDDVTSWLEGNTLCVAGLPAAETTQRLLLCLRDNTIIEQRRVGWGKSQHHALVFVIQQLNMAEDPLTLSSVICRWQNSEKRETYIVLVGGTLLRRHVAWCDLLGFVTVAEPHFRRLLLANISEMVLSGNHFSWRLARQATRLIRRKWWKQ